MKRFLSILLVALLLPIAALAENSEAILVDDAPYAAAYGCAVTPDGNTIIDMGLRYKENRRKGENPTVARLVCMGQGGEVLWEHKDAENDSIYAKPCVLADGTVMAVYTIRLRDADEGLSSSLLRRFSAQGELLGEVAIPETAFQYLPTDAGMVITFIDHDEQDNPVNTLMLYDATLAPVWKIDDMRCVFRFDRAYKEDDGLVLLYREFSISKGVEEVRLLRIDAEGKIEWKNVLANRQMGYMNLKRDTDGNSVVYLGGWDVNQSPIGTLYCFSPDGSELWQKPVTLPSNEGELCDFQLTEDGFLLMGEAKTETCVRLYRYDMGGQLIGTTDQSIHEELQLSRPRFAALNGKPYACVMEEWDDGDRYSTYLLPISIP